MKRLALISCCVFFSVLTYADIEDNASPYSPYLYGGIGLIDTPTARFSSDGEFVFGVSSESPLNRIYSNMQFFPWLEATLKYTENKSVPYSEGSHQTWKDKGIDLKFRITEESNQFPSIAIGLLDIGGTGAYAGEYIVASKAIKNMDLSLGLGWGILGGLDHLNNIFGHLDNKRNNRLSDSGLGGTIDLDQFFSGKNTSIFGGIEYFTPINNLSLKLEYNTTDYSNFVGKEKSFDKSGDIFECISMLPN